MTPPISTLTLQPAPVERRNPARIVAETARELAALRKTVNLKIMAEMAQREAARAQE